MKYLTVEEVAERLNVRPITLSQRFWQVKHGTLGQKSIYYALYHNIVRKSGTKRLFFPMVVLDKWESDKWLKQDTIYQALNMIEDIIADGLSTEKELAKILKIPHNGLIKYRKSIRQPSYERSLEIINKLKKEFEVWV